MKSLPELKSLENELSRLSKETLPVKTKAAIQVARRRIAEIEAKLKNGDDSSKLGALYRVSQTLGNSLNLDDVLTLVMDAVIQLTGAERGFLTLIDPDTGNLDLEAARNIEQETLQKEDMEISRTVVQSVINSGEGVVTTDAQSDPRFARQESVIIYSLRSILCAPLKVRGVIIGVIYVDNKAQSSLFTKDDLELLNAFASQAAVAIENARSYTRTDQALNERVSELETLSQVDLQINETLDLKRVVSIIQQWVLKVTGAGQCWVTISGEESGLQVLISEAAAEDAAWLETRILPHLSNDLFPKEVRIKKENQDGTPSENSVYLLVPLLFARKNIGAIIAARPDSFSEQAAVFLSRLAARSAAAVENARLYQAVQNANEAKSQFVSIVTHELRIPLTSIKGYTDLILQGIVGPINTQQQEFLRVIGNNVDRMAALISDLSDISRIERGIIKLRPEFLAVEHSIAETIHSLRHRLDEKHQSISTELPSSFPPAYADPSRLIQVLTNLVSNAWKYTPEGGKVQMRVSTVQKMLKIEVIDNGIGISTEDQAKMFTQFFRSEDAAVREQTGWGLGLNVTKRLVELMGGEIGMRSRLGQGSTFWFTLPTIKPAEENENSEIRE